MYVRVRKKLIHACMHAYRRRDQSYIYIYIVCVRVNYRNACMQACIIIIITK